jgi:uroporphyrin-III C-methyltransferase / precorrin-2 dehydrogenase / sirohydrochlorin ferrochelatase
MLLVSPRRRELRMRSGKGDLRPVDATVYPVGLRLAGRLVVVVGGGAVGQRRIGGLLAAKADVLLISPHVTASLEATAAGERLRWLPRAYKHGDLDGAWYVHACTDDPAANAAVAAEAAARRIFCVRSDDAASASAWTPAIGRHDDVTLAVFGGGDPRRAAAVRDGALERLRDGSIAAPKFRGPVSVPVSEGDAPAAESSGSAGALRSSSQPSVATGTAGHTGESPADKTSAGQVILVGAGPGDMDLITVRGRRALAAADVVVADRLVPQALLDELPPQVEVIDVAKIPRGRAATQEDINSLLVARARAGQVVVRLKGGDPFVFGRGYEEVAACVSAGIPYTVVPGVTSAIAVPAAAGIPVTHRGVAQEVSFVAGHLPPGDPRSQVDWSALARGRGTLVLLMAVEQLRAIASVLVEHGRDASTRVAIIESGTTERERVVDATLDTAATAAAESGVRPPAVIVIGDVVAMARPGRG